MNSAEWCRLYGLERYLLELKHNNTKRVHLFDLLAEFGCFKTQNILSPGDSDLDLEGAIKMVDALILNEESLYTKEA